MVLKGENSELRELASGIGRRAVLCGGIAMVTASAAAPAFAMVGPYSERHLAIRNLHTGETVRTMYWARGVWQADGLREIAHIMRDFRTGERMDIDPDLLDQLHGLASLTRTDEPFEIYSGYRSPSTNAQLARQSSGVARKSFHMQGRAVDLRLPGVKISSLRRSAMSLRLGGVGYYPKSGFIHIDTGPVRSW